MTRLADTSPDAWIAQNEALLDLAPSGRVRVAIELSDAVREIQIDGVLARNPGWTRAMAVRHIVASQMGVVLPQSP